MTNQERQDYQIYEQNQTKEEIQNQNQVQKQGKKGGYSKNYKEGSQRGNQNILEDKNTNQNINEYNNNYQNFRKHKKGYTNYQGKNQNEEFDNRQRTNSPQGFKKNKRKRKEQKEEFIFENQQSNHTQMYNKTHKKNQINNQQQRPNQINNNNNMNTNNNNNFLQNINNNNEQFKQNINLNGNTLNNQNFNFQNQQNQNKQNINKGHNMLMNAVQNQNMLYNMNQMKQNEGEKKDEKLSEGTTEDLSQSSFSNMNRMIENQDNINRHINMGNANMNQFITNDMLMNKNYIQQQNYQRLPNLYNMTIPIEQNQLFNNMNNQNSNFPFAVNEDSMKYKKMNKKIQKSPNEGNMVNMNPNINMGNMVNIPNLNFPSQIPNNNKFFKNNNNVSLNNKGSLSMQGNKNTMPNFNSNLNLNFMIPQKSPQAPQNTIPPNMINQNLNLNMSQRNFYNNNQNNMSKRHQQLIYKRVNSDKNLLGIENKSKDLYNHNIQNKNFQKFHNHNNNINNNNLQNPNLQQQKMFQIKEEWINNLKNIQNQQQHMYNLNNNVNQLKKSLASSLRIAIKIDKKKYEILELKPGEEPKNLINSLKTNNNNLSEPLISLIYQKINNALNFNKCILDLVPSKYTLKQMNMIKNCLIDKENNGEMKNRIEPFLERNTSFIDNQNQFQNFISEIKPSYEDIKVTDILNITQ